MYIYTTVVAACGLGSLPSSIVSAPASSISTQAVAPVYTAPPVSSAVVSSVTVSSATAAAGEFYQKPKESAAPKVEKPLVVAEQPKVEPPKVETSTLVTSAIPAPTSTPPVLKETPVVKQVQSTSDKPSSGGSGSVSVTPHDKYSSSIGVLGCKVNTNRIAYWPLWPSCNDLCVKVSANGRSVTLLHIDTSGGAHDISYDAWNYLYTGNNATSNPSSGGGLAATYEFVPMDQCSDILNDGQLPLMAANSMGFYNGCGADSWVGKNSKLWNIQNCACTLGHNEECKLDLSVSNQASCPHQLGDNAKLEGLPVVDIEYMTGKEKVAVQ